MPNSKIPIFVFLGMFKISNGTPKILLNDFRAEKTFFSFLSI